MFQFQILLLIPNRSKWENKFLDVIGHWTSRCWTGGSPVRGWVFKKDFILILHARHQKGKKHEMAVFFFPVTTCRESFDLIRPVSVCVTYRRTWIWQGCCHWDRSHLSCCWRTVPTPEDGATPGEQCRDQTGEKEQWLFVCVCVG